MVLLNAEKLDNPVWHALTDCQLSFGIDYGKMKFYHPDYCPFGAFDKNDGIAKGADEYAKLVNDFYVVGERPVLSAPLQIINDRACFQMIINKKIDIEITEKIVPLSNDHSYALYELVNLVQPGYFKQKTALLGNYFGIFEDGILVAVTGERMRMNEWTEISAVATHPKYTGKGYAKQLIALTVKSILAQHKMPFLHVVETNAAAIQLYEKLGFETRRRISFWNVAPSS